MISKGVKSIFPIKNQEIWDRYKQHIQAFWTTEEVSLQDDLRDLETLNDGEKHFIKHVLAYFANSCLLYTSPSPRDRVRSRMPSSA